MSDEIHEISAIAVKDSEAERIPRVDPGRPPSRADRMARGKSAAERSSAANSRVAGADQITGGSGGASREAGG